MVAHRSTVFCCCRPAGILSTELKHWQGWARSMETLSPALKYPGRLGEGGDAGTFVPVSPLLDVMCCLIMWEGLCLVNPQDPLVALAAFLQHGWEPLLAAVPLLLAHCSDPQSPGSGRRWCSVKRARLQGRKVGEGCICSVGSIQLWLLLY